MNSALLFVIMVLNVFEILCSMYLEVGLFLSNQRLGNLPEDIGSGDLAEFKGSGSKCLCVSLRD